MAIPSSILDSLLLMDEYEKMLSIDRISREHGLSSEQVSQELANYVAATPNVQSNANQTNASASFDVTAEKTAPSLPTNPTAEPKYISSTSNLRMRYDPTQQGAARQKSVEQAILCPTCSAPLGIPSQRPILVTCPNCMTQSRFEN